jgi:hypothetical protein
LGQAGASVKDEQGARGGCAGGCAPPSPRVSLRRGEQPHNIQFAERAGATVRANEAPLPRGPLLRAAPKGRFRGPPSTWAAPCGPTAGPKKRCSRGRSKRVGDTMLSHRWANEAPLPRAAEGRRARGPVHRAPPRRGRYLTWQKAQTVSSARFLVQCTVLSSTSLWCQLAESRPVYYLFRFDIRAPPGSVVYSQACPARPLLPC